tara:strand:- start:3990 stop:4361 length:372 start_codon:yes stop_codon:yes gene_type:complete
MNTNFYIVLFLIVVALILIFSTPKPYVSNDKKASKKVSFAKEDDVRITPTSNNFPQTKFSNDIKINKETNQTPTMDLDQVYKSTQATRIVPMDDPYSKPMSQTRTRFMNEKQEMIGSGHSPFA